jgi:uncharacterized membrane protein YgdD (TMEM256/DUF423 family)
MSNHRWPADSYDETSVDRLFITLAALSGCLAVALGAFGAHALRDRLSPDALQVFQTGVSYQMYHALALLAVGILLARFSTQGSAWLSAAGWLFAAGSLLFSGSLYLLALSGTTWLGAITPLGGVAFLLGWLAVAIGVWR